MVMFLDEFSAASRFLNLDAIWDVIHKILIVGASCKDGVDNFVSFIRCWHSLDNAKALVVQDLVDSGAVFNHVCSTFFGVRKSYCALKLAESLRTKEVNIRSAIDKKMDSFETNKSHTIRSVLKCPFYKVVLDHLVVNNKPVLEPDLVKSKWYHQYQSLGYVFDRAFADMMCLISFDEFFEVVFDLPDGKAADLLGISNELWKHCNRPVLNMLLVLLNSCLFGVLINTYPIALIKTACKILSKIFSNRIFSACSTYDVLCKDNFSVLKNTTTQSPIFAIGSVIENALEKNQKIWLVLQDMRKTYDSVSWKYLEKSLVRIKMCDRFIQFFGNIHRDCTNYVITDFGLLDGYCVHDGLDQGKVFSLLLWGIFYDLLLCEVKHCYHNNKFKVATTPDTTTLKFNIPDEIEVVKKSVYQYIENCINNYFFGNYNISEIRSNLYNNLVHYSQLGTEDLNSKTLATYFQELNFNIIEYCKEKYPVQPKYSFNFESETETSNKDKQKVKQYSRTTPNTPILPKTTAKHLQIPEQETSVKLPLSITPFLISLVQPQTPSSLLNHFSRPEDFQLPRNSTQQQEPISTNANIIDYLQKNENNHSESLESEETESKPEEITENKEKMTTAYIAKIPEFTDKDNDTSPQEWFDKVQKAGDTNGWNATRMLKAIPYFFQGIAEEWFENLEEPFENWQAFKNFIAGLKDKLIKKVHPHALANLATVIRHAKSYEIAIEEANHTKLVNLAIRETSLAAEEKIDQLTKKISTPTIIQPKQFWITIQQPTSKLSNQHYSLPQQSYYQPLSPTYYSPRSQIQNSYYQPAPQLIQQQYQQSLPIQQIQTPSTQQYQVPARRLLISRNSGQQRPNHFYTQPSYLTMPEESDFQQTALSESRNAALKSNLFNHTIPPAQIAQNTNLSNIFLFEFEANESPFLLSNAVVNEWKAITAMYTEAIVEGKSIHLILDTDATAQTKFIVTADGIKKTPVEKIDDFSFTIDGITILVKVLVMDAPQYQALKKVRYSTLEPRKEPPYIPLKYKDCKKKLSSMGVCICPKKEYETCTYYFCKACHRERFGSPKRSGKWDNTPCLTCRDILPKECNWIDVVMKGGVCDQTCQYALSILEKVRRETPFDAAYNSALNKLYHYPYDAEMIFDLAMALINRATQENVHQMKEAEYIEYTMELAEFDYENKVETYHQITSHTYPIQEAQIQ
ncbi:hypothetical protein G9A89_010356 [Geosiphon pyriformis]|nr:hypothetical protein G9A89_010356 [Geosiphon pyriformis]